VAESSLFGIRARGEGKSNQLELGIKGGEALGRDSRHFSCCPVKGGETRSKVSAVAALSPGNSLPGRVSQKPE